MPRRADRRRRLPSLLLVTLIPPWVSGCPVTGPCDTDPLGCEAHPDLILVREPDCPAALPPIAVQLGGGEGAFRPYGEEDALPLVMGAQGGGHLEVGFSARGLALAPGRVVEGLRITLAADEPAEPCAEAADLDARAFDDTAASPPTGTGAPEACMRETGSRVILYGPGGVDLRTSDAGALEASGLVLFAGGFLGPGMPLRLRVLVEDSCGRQASASHVFTR